MTKKEYLDRLYYEIGNMDNEQKVEIISIFIEHFEHGALNGKSEEEICVDLGQPSQVAAQFIADNRDKLRRISPDGESVDSGESGYIHEQKHTSNSHTWDHAQLADTITKPLDPTVNINKSFSAQSIGKLNINLNHSDIKLFSRGDRFTVALVGHSRNSTYEVYEENGTLNVIETRKFTLINLLNFNKPVKIEICVPTDYNGMLCLTNKAGDVSLGDISAERAELQLTAGDIRVNGFKGFFEIFLTAGNARLNHVSGNMDICSTAGDITIEDCNGSVKVESKAGNVKIINNTGFISATTSAGNVKIIADELTGLSALSSAGSVKIEAKKLTGDAKLVSSAGSVKFEVHEVRASISAKTSMGSVTLLLPHDASMRIVSKSVSKIRSALRSDPSSPYTLDVNNSFGDINIKCLD